MFSAVHYIHYGKRPARAAKPRDTNRVLRTANLWALCLYYVILFDGWQEWACFRRIM